MIKIKSTFSSFSVNDQKKAEDFYRSILGLKVEDNGMGLGIDLPSGGHIHIYPKEDHQPATFTVLNFEVKNIDEAVDALTKAGISFERYEGFNQDEKGITRGGGSRGPSIAWFKDPAGNILSVLETIS